MKEFLAVVAVGLFGSATVAGAPRVVRAEPDDGDADVDPGLRELRIEFDQDMPTRGHSICGGGEEFPEMSGRPRWVGKRTVVIPVKLQPDVVVKVTPAELSRRDPVLDAALGWIRESTAAPPKMGGSPTEREARTGTIPGNTDAPAPSGW